VRLQALTPQLAREINASTDECRVPEVNGVLVVEVMPGSPAAQSGLKPCDLIEQVGGNDVKNPSQVQLAVDGGRVGAPLTIGIRRQSQKAQVVVRPAELPQQG